MFLITQTLLYSIMKMNIFSFISAGSSLLNEQGNEPGQSSQTMSSINPQAVETALSNDTSPPSYELGATATALSHDDDQIGFYENGVFVDDVESLIL